MDQRFDVIIVGSGAGGGTLARHLAPSGKSILILERGDWLTREAENWDAATVFVHNRYVSPDTWYDAHGRPFQPQVHYFVGGATKMFGAALYRLRQRDFGEVRHYDGVSPAWPIGYEELEPYYAKAEDMYHVHGERGVDPTEPPASGPYPCPPVSHEPRMQQLNDDFAGLGLKPFHVPLGVQLHEEDRHTSKCIRCETCDGFPCLVHAKSDAQVVCVDPALRFPGVKLLTNAYVEKLKTSPTGREVTSAVVRRNGAAEEYSASIVVVSCGAINSAALLLRSANDKPPRGLANSSDIVGRHYMGHVNSVLMAVSKCPNPTIFQKTLA